MKPIVAIIGKANVGKSTLFNQLIEKKKAITSPVAGTTRDRIYETCALDKLDVILIDTGGLQLGARESIEKDVTAQTLLAIREATLILWVIDGSISPTIEDEQVLREMKKAKKPYICIANKADRSISESERAEYYRLGVPDIIAVSAAHGRGVADVKTATEKQLRKMGYKKFDDKADTKERKKKKIINIAILGRPNVGKSSLVNALAKSPKMIVSDVPGTTRDTVDTEIQWKERTFILKDTAGIRKRGKIGRDMEFWSVLRGIKALEESDIAVLIIDGLEGIVSQDAHIAGFIKEEKKGLIIALNKIDRLDSDTLFKVEHEILHKLEFLPWSPLVHISALRGTNIDAILKLAVEINEKRKKTVTSGELHHIIEEAIARHPPSKDTRIITIKQIGISPPSFEILVNHASGFHFSYRRFLEHEIRKRFDLEGTAIDLRIKEVTPYKERATHAYRMKKQKMRNSQSRSHHKR